MCSGGWVLSTLCLALVTVMAVCTALWLVDVSLRAQYIKRSEMLLRGGNGDQGESLNQPPVSVRVQHRFEMNELVEMFMGLRARRFYELLVIIYLVGALWSYTSVFASSLASHVGIPGINGGHECDIYKDGSSSCTNLYLFYIALFSLVSVPLTCLDLTEMKLLQIALAIFRFVSLATMMITSIVAIYSYPNPDPEAHSSAHAPYYSNMVAFDWTNLGLVFPIAIYAQIFHHSVPGLTHPLKDKRAAPRVFTGVLVTTMVLYSALGISVGFFYGASIPQTCTLAWADYTGGHDKAGEGKPGWAVFISYLIVLFPPLDIISAFPLNAITLGNNLLCTFVDDVSKQSLLRIKIPFRLLAAVPPIVGACVVKDLGVILKYTGCVGVLIAFAYPCVLQWKSVQMCKNRGIVNTGEQNLPPFSDNTSAEAASTEEEEEDETEHPYLRAARVGVSSGGGDRAAVVSSPSPDSGYDASTPLEERVPTYNVSVLNRPGLVWIVFAFSVVGLVSVIVLSAAGISS